MAAEQSRLSDWSFCTRSLPIPHLILCFLFSAKQLSMPSRLFSLLLHPSILFFVFFPTIDFGYESFLSVSFVCKRAPTLSVHLQTWSKRNSVFCVCQTKRRLSVNSPFIKPTPFYTCVCFCILSAHCYFSFLFSFYVCSFYYFSMIKTRQNKGNNERKTK